LDGCTGSWTYDYRVAVVRNILYWLVVLLVSLALVAGLILLLESRDRASLGTSLPGGAPVSAA
jgi:hypothetical protein